MSLFFRGVATLAVVSCANPASAAWLEAKSKHFIIYSEQDQQQLKAYAARLERFDLAVRKARGKDDPPLTDSNRLMVFVLANQRAVEDLNGTPGVAGYYIPRVTGPVAFVHRGRQSSDRWDLEAETVFFHEYLHHMMLQDLQMALPHWMIEGYAEFFATAEMLDDGAVRFGAVPAHRAQSLFNWGNYAMSLQDMVSVNYKDAEFSEVVSVYGLGWLLTHYLTFEPSRRGQATKYALAIQSGTPASEAAKAAFGDLKQLDRELQKYVARKTVSSVTVPAADLQVGDIAIRPLSEAESAIMKVRMRSSSGVNKESAPGVAADARRIGERFPADAAVQAALAEAELDAKHLEAAAAAADRAIAIDRRNTAALIYKGRALMEIGKRDPAKADWGAIRTLFARANKVDPEDPEPLMLYYQTYKAQGANPPKIAIDGLLYAHLLVPQDEELRLLVFRQLVMDKKLKEARETFSTIAFNPHLEGKRRKKIIAIMDQLNSDDAIKALTLLDELEKEDKKKRD